MSQAELDKRYAELNTMDSAECYIRPLGNRVVLTCERSECMWNDGFGDVHYFEYLPEKCLPEYAVIRRAKHLATHTDAVERPASSTPEEGQ